MSGPEFRVEHLAVNQNAVGSLAGALHPTDKTSLAGRGVNLAKTVRSHAPQMNGAFRADTEPHPLQFSDRAEGG